MYFLCMKGKAIIVFGGLFIFKRQCSTSGVSYTDLVSPGFGDFGINLFFIFLISRLGHV